jgi:PAS domain S-box-containing protein
MNGNALDSAALLASMNDGVYATDTDRRIVYWSPAAERITGWEAGDILGKRCSDDVLCHTDKDGRPLCGKEHCPLHRAMVTGKGSVLPVIVYASGKDGQRIPMRVSTSPVRDAGGEVIGGVEVFRDVSEEHRDAELTRRIQTTMLERELPRDDRVSFAMHYIPWGMVGGDYYAVARVDEDRFAFLLADVSGHGMAAALYTVYLNALWEGGRELLPHPGQLAGAMNAKLYELIGDDSRFATAVVGVLDLARMQAVLTFAGGPPPFLYHQDGGMEEIEGSGLPLGCLPDTEYQEHTTALRAGDCLLAFSDGAVEITDTDGELLGTEGLASILREAGYPGCDGFQGVEERLLKFSDRIRFSDDMTFFEARLA